MLILASTISLVKFLFFFFVAMADYTAYPMLLTVGSDSPGACVIVMAIQDGILEGDEQFSLLLLSADPAVMVQQPITVVTLLDRDSEFKPCLLSLCHCNYPYTTS